MLLCHLASGKVSVCLKYDTNTCATVSDFYIDPLRVLFSSALAGTNEKFLPIRVMAPFSVIKPAVLCLQTKSW